jgi:S1-C subfamily serine protease
MACIMFSTARETAKVLLSAMPRCPVAIALVCGISWAAAAESPAPAAAPSSVVAPVASTPTAQDKAIDSLRTEVSEIKKKAEKPPKDAWDKLTAVSGLASGLVVALIGFYATNVYNRRQKASEERRKDQELLIAQIQTVEKFFPHLSSTHAPTKSGALIAIAALGNEELAVRLAKAFSGPGATTALTTIASTASAPGAAQAAKALLDVLAYLKPRVITLHRGKERVATAFAVSDDGKVVTTAHAIDAIPVGELMIGLPDATLVPGSVVRIDAARDLALLSVPPHEALAPLNLSPSSPAPGERVTGLFIRRDGSMRVEIGTVVQVGMVVPRIGQSTSQRIGVQLNVEPGASGTPVVDQEGRLLGLVQGTKDGITILIAADEAVAFVAESAGARDVRSHRERPAGGESAG